MAVSLGTPPKTRLPLLPQSSAMITLGKESDSFSQILRIVFWSCASDTGKGVMFLSYHQREKRRAHQ